MNCDHQPLLHSLYKVIELPKGCALPPQAQAGHVCHVARLGGPRGRGIHHTGLGQAVLQVEHSLTRLGWLGGTRGTQILGFVTLIQDDLRCELRKL